MRQKCQVTRVAGKGDIVFTPQLLQYVYVAANVQSQLMYTLAS